MSVESISQEALLAFLRERAIFQDLDEDALIAVINRMGEYELPAERDLFHHKDAGYTFYIIYKGKVRIWRTEGGKELEFGTMENGDKFGEESLLYKRPRSATISTLAHTHFLTLDNSAFTWLLKTYPSVKDRLHNIAQSHQTSRRESFSWLGKNEVIHLIAQRHSFELLNDLWKPVLIGSLGAFMGLLGIFGLTQGIKVLLFSLAGIMSGIGIAWFLWEFFDWRNDYFIITSQRVVWLEKVALLSESRQESPISAIQSINITTSYWGRIFGFGDIDIRTYTGTGSLHLTTVDDPEHFKRQIEELIIRVRGKSQTARTESMRHSIRQSLGMDAGEAVDTDIGLLDPDEKKEGGLGFTTREIESDVIIYHKHPWLLFTKTIGPLMLFSIIFGGMVYFSWRDMLDAEVTFPSINFSLALGIPLLIGFALYIWYQYADWANDLYQVSFDTIIDRDRKPFGKENTQSAPLKNVQGISYSRDGFINTLLNMGDVHIVIADETLTFDNVHHPSHVQQDIFYRLERLKHQQEEMRLASESEAMLGWLKIYHEIVQDNNGEELDDPIDAEDG